MKRVHARAINEGIIINLFSNFAAEDKLLRY